MSQEVVPSVGRRIGYARVSTEEQSLNLQLDAMRAAGVNEVREEKASGRDKHRPVLAALLNELRAGDVLVAWKIDRVARSTRHLLEIVEDLDTRQIGFVSTTQAIDTTTPHGRFFLTMLAAVAELEADTIRERVVAGMTAAKMRGVEFGPARKVTPSKIDAARKLIAADPTASVTSIARTISVGRSTLYRSLQQLVPA